MAEITFGTPLQNSATKILLLGSGELGKEFVIEAQRLGVEVLAVDTYEGAPAMQVAHRSRVMDMQDGEALYALVEDEQPDLIVPEVEAIATATLEDLEQEGFNVVPTANATRLTMDREYIRRLVAEDLELRTSPYAFASDAQEFQQAVEEIGVPCVVKPVMSSSGKGQSTIREGDDPMDAWEYAMAGSRGRSTRVIVEGFVQFDTEITLMTVRHADGTSYCPPIGHRQEDGDYRESWQPEAISQPVLQTCKTMADDVTRALGGFGIFGVEFFIEDETVYFSELSPRPHDTGMVTMVTQDLSEFALHARAILGLPVPRTIKVNSPGASAVLLADKEGTNPRYTVDDAPLRVPGTELRLFGKPTTRPGRRMGVGLARGKDVDEARARARAIADGVTVHHD